MASLAKVGKALGTKRPEWEVALTNIKLLGISSPERLSQIFYSSDRFTLWEHFVTAVAFSEMSGVTSRSYLAKLLDQQDYIRLSHLTSNQNPPISASMWRQALQTGPGLKSKILVQFPEEAELEEPPSDSFIPQEWLSDMENPRAVALNLEGMIAAARYYGFPILKGKDLTERKNISKFVSKFFSYYLYQVDAIPALLKYSHINYSVADDPKPSFLKLKTPNASINQFDRDGSRFSFWPTDEIVSYARNIAITGEPIMIADMVLSLFKWSVYCDRVEIFREVIKVWGVIFRQTTKDSTRSGTAWFIKYFPKSYHSFHFVEGQPQRLYPFVEILVDSDPENAMRLLLGYNPEDGEMGNMKRSLFIEDLVRAGDIGSLELILKYGAQYEPKPAIWPKAKTLAENLEYRDIVALIDAY